MFERSKTLFTVAGLVKRAGFKRADEILGFLADWRQFIVSHDRPPDSFEEYAQWTRLYSRRTAWSRLALLRSVYPEAGADVLPTDFLGGLLDRVEAELREADTS